MQFQNYSEVKCVCVWLLRFLKWVRHWSLCRKVWPSQWPILTHDRISNPHANPNADADADANPNAPNSVQWLACVSNDLCIQQTYYVHGSNSVSCILSACNILYMLQCNSDGHLNWELFGHWTNIPLRSHIPLRFSKIVLCGSYRTALVYMKVWPRY